MSTRKTPAAVCHWCEKTLRVFAAGGDWTNDAMLPNHKDSNLSICKGAFRRVNDEAIIWPETEKKKHHSPQSPRPETRRGTPTPELT